MAHTSDWAQQEDNTVTVDEEEAEQEEPAWAKQEGDDPEARLSDWGSEGGEGEGERSEDEFLKDGEFPEPPEDAKLFVGNLPYDVDSQKLAMLFEQAGTVEIAEVSL